MPLDFNKLYQLQEKNSGDWAGLNPAEQKVVKKFQTFISTDSFEQAIQNALEIFIERGETKEFQIRLYQPRPGDTTISVQYYKHLGYGKYEIETKADEVRIANTIQVLADVFEERLKELGLVILTRQYDNGHSYVDEYIRFDLPTRSNPNID